VLHTNPVSQLDFPSVRRSEHAALRDAITASNGKSCARREVLLGGNRISGRAEQTFAPPAGQCQHIDKANPQVLLGTVEEARSLQVLHQGAVYLHQARPTLWTRLEPFGSGAFVKRDVDYYTSRGTTVDIRISPGHRLPLSAGTRDLGAIEVTTHVTGY